MIKIKINKKALISSLNYLWIPEIDSIFEDIFKLPPAHCFDLDINSLDLNIKQYWKIEDNTSKLSEKDLIIKLEKLFNDSVYRHMVSDVPVGSFLSGGLDSSMISVAAGKLSKKLSTYTIGTSYRDKKIESMPDDQKYAKIIAELNNFDHNEIVLSSDIIKILPEIVKTLDEPIGDPAAINTFLICQKAREKGAKVILSGMGADEIFCGYRRQKALIYSKTYKKIPAFMRIVISNIARLIPVRLGSHGLRIFRWLKKFLSFAELPLEEAYRMSYSYYSKDELNKLLKDDANEIINSIYDDHYKIFSKYYQNDFINQMCYTDIINFMNGLNLTYTDRASMAASVEVRVPFIDKELISFAMTIPGRYKFKSGNSKYILKIAEKLLPKKIIYRPKASFGAPIRSWISNDLSDMVDKCLSKEQIEKRGIFDYNYINKIINDDRKGLRDNAYQIYQLLTIELWFKEYID